MAFFFLLIVVKLSSTCWGSLAARCVRKDSGRAIPLAVSSVSSSTFALASACSCLNYLPVKLGFSFGYLGDRPVRQKSPAPLHRLVRNAFMRQHSRKHRVRVLKVLPINTWRPTSRFSVRLNGTQTEMRRIPEIARKLERPILTRRISERMCDGGAVKHRRLHVGRRAAPEAAKTTISCVSLPPSGHGGGSSRVWRC